MYLELENEVVVVDLRTKKDVLDYIKDYDVDIPQLDDEDCYFHGSLYDFKQETGMSDEQVVDMLFEIEDEDERYIEHTYFTDRGAHRTLELRLGEMSYFEYDECDYEPGYPYIDKITKEKFDEKIKEIYYFIEAYQMIEK
jgi:hypothetical protein